tara:strand:+ start:114 stop:611 length:498 start_codon:yes stop_codon:yes gene_type:complete
MSNNSKDNQLEVEIYYDAYPKPKLVTLLKTDTDIPFKSSITRKEPAMTAITINHINSPKINNINDINSPKIININDNDNDNDNDNHNGNINIYTFVFTTIFCIGIGIMCIMIALKENKPDENNFIKLEGEIIYVFYLGAGILFCIGFCLCATLCAQCCDICLVLT